jgi:hypothetical protein
MSTQVHDTAALGEGRWVSQIVISSDGSLLRRQIFRSAAEQRYLYGGGEQPPPPRKRRARRLPAAVTFKPKCYVYRCIACDDFFDTNRSDALTCSPACRVRAHLCPHLVPLIAGGKLTLKEARGEVWQTYKALLWKAVDAANTHPESAGLTTAGGEP